MDYIRKTFVMNSGERYSLLIEASTGIPLYYPNLYLTTQVRNRSLSHSAMEASLNGISVLIRYLDQKEENLESRFQNHNYFAENELDDIRDYCQLSFRKKNKGEKTNNILRLSKNNETRDMVCSETEYQRLTVIAHYLAWFAEQVSVSNKKKIAITKMEKGIKARRPVKKKRNTESDEKGLDENQFSLLFEVFRPESPLNPFKDQSVRLRNRLIFLMLYHLGLRGGELLNIRINDIDFGKNQLVIARRADEKNDPRTFQPLVKTQDRRLPMKETLAKEIHSYILSERKKVKNSGKNNFLFVTHKAGPTIGQPLSKSGYNKVLNIVRKTSPSLYNLTGHSLRHSWNETFSAHMDDMDNPLSTEQQEKIRSYLMGWKEGSGTAAIYNKRFIKGKANEAALKLQEGLTRLPKGMCDE